MKVFSVSLTANVQVSVRGGNFLMLIDTTAPLDVTLMNGGAEIEKAESVEAGFKAHARFADLREDGGRYFDEARLLSTTTQTIKVGISDGAGGYDRALGEVTSEPKLTQSAAAPVGLDALVYNGFCFFGNIGLVAVAAAYPHIQLLNPAGNTKTIYVDAIRTSQSVSGIQYAVTYDTPLAALAGTGGGSARLGGAPGTAQIRTESPASLLVGMHIQSLACAQNTPQEIVLPHPIILEAGKGVVLQASPVNQNFYASFRWREYA